MKTDCEMWSTHEGHELEIPGEKWPETIGISWCGNSKTGTFRCPKCGIEEEVLRTGKICEYHEYGEHIQIYCKVCGKVGHTKNIGHIGSRTLFEMCEHSVFKLYHTCEKLKGSIRK